MDTNGYNPSTDEMPVPTLHEVFDALHDLEDVIADARSMSGLVDHLVSNDLPDCGKQKTATVTYTQLDRLSFASVQSMRLTGLVYDQWEKVAMLCFRFEEAARRNGGSV
ncbi:hypothetical protein IGS74_18890 [Aureimonas sp. OT7]|uniref:hypothetical protein n=1 Tax=Aureimonas sp. OT7 TaxID=2816454 RepID=UPI0017868AB7|nr:hypothetical protein [Aureimonas sp. OT7]QOG06549.1 hypothetical protein IGS74_18890 [Aureimonas sp. OT7]